MTRTPLCLLLLCRLSQRCATQSRPSQTRAALRVWLKGTSCERDLLLEGPSTVLRTHRDLHEPPERRMKRVSSEPSLMSAPDEDHLGDAAQAALEENWQLRLSFEAIRERLQFLEGTVWSSRRWPSLRASLPP